MAKKLDIQFPTPLPLFRSSPKIDHLTDWAESQITPVSRQIAHKMVENLQYIAFEDFLKQLQKTVNDFHEKIKDDSYVLLVGELRSDKLARGCSDKWVTGLALEYCGLKSPEAILTPNQLKARQNTHTTVTNIFMLDDAAYSGEQKSRILEYFGDPKNKIKSGELSFYIGIPFMTHYAKNTLSAKSFTFKKLIFTDHVYMASTADILDAKEIFYAEQTNIGLISRYQTLTYFDHRFADFYSCFQQIYDGSNLLMNQSVYMMNFLGYTFNPELARRNKNLQLITEANQYNTIAISLTDPNNCIDSGYTIPEIIPPYQLHQYQRKQDLAHAIEFGKIGDRSPYPANDPEIAAILAKPASHNIRFFSYKKSTLSLEKQTEYDKAVMLGNQNEITYDEQVDRHKKHQQLRHELKRRLPIIKSLNIELRHPYIQYLTDTLTQIFNIFMVAMGLRILLSLFQEVIPCNSHSGFTNGPN